MRAYVEGVGLCGPGLADWPGSRRLFGSGYRALPTSVPASALLPAAERRRVGVPVRLALAVGQEAFAAAGRDAAETPTVFTSSGGDCDNVHHLCESLAAPAREVSPTRFHNSVHNVVAGYWSIATRCHAASTSLCYHDASFAAGLLDAVVQGESSASPVALVAYDHPYPAPLAAARPIADSFGMALVLAPARTARAFAVVEIEFVAEPAAATPMPDAGLEAVRAGIPAARSLPVLAALAAGRAATVILDYARDMHLRIEVTPCR